VNRGTTEREADRRASGRVMRIPSAERLKQGPVVIIECPEEIPCNPCEGACPHEAIRIGLPITTTPTLVESRCVGCGLCVPRCPGLAIFLVDMTFSESEALVSFPFEYLPLPEPGDACVAVDGEGQAIGQAIIHRVQDPRSNDSTPVVTVRVSHELAPRVRGIERTA